eukprot:GFUD01008011.1.p1 GENE.GFUD01008011.1~~GFUD01008011.1.p1  ORF type:complete len:2535 (+),score=676.26 GFUD01008011.1:509-8113(+)
MNRTLGSSNKVFLEDLDNRSMAKKSKLETGDVLTVRSSRQVARDTNLDTEVAMMKRKRSGSRTSADSSRNRQGSTSKRARKCSGEQAMVQVKEEKIICTKCKETFDPSEFRRHNMLEHEFKCDQDNCDYFLESDLGLINHKKKVHFIEPDHSYSSNWQLVCEACGKSIPVKQWEAHSKTDHQFHCLVDSDPDTGCFMRFLTEVLLNSHIKSAHKYAKVTPPKQNLLPEVKIIPFMPKIKKKASADPAKTEIKFTCAKTTPVKSQKPLALRPGSPMFDENYWMCHMCRDLFESQDKMDNHVKKLGDKHINKCKENGCGNLMCNIALLLKHYWDVHNKQVKVKFCETCKDVVDVKSWAAHSKREHTSKCGYEGCHATTVTNKLLWQHMIKKHDYGRFMNPSKDEVGSEDEEIVEIDSTKSRFGTSFELDVDEIENDVIREEDTKSKGSVESFEFVEQVVEPDEGDFIKCKVCELLVKRGRLQHHCNKVHKFKCIVGCDLAFTQEHLMYNHCFLEHNNTEHISKKGYLVCPECSEFFEPTLRNSYEIHVKNGKHETCAKCEKKFCSSMKDEFNFHCDYEHSSASDIPCPKCDLTFTSSDKRLLERHLQKNHCVGPCPHCKQIKSVCLFFVTKEHFAKHHEQEHSTSKILGCDCLDRIARNVQLPYDNKNEFDIKSEDAYDLSEQITDESIDEEILNYKNNYNYKTDEDSAMMKDSDLTDDCLNMYFEANPVKEDELKSAFPLNESLNETPVEVEISVQATKVDEDHVCNSEEKKKIEQSAELETLQIGQKEEEHIVDETEGAPQNILEIFDENELIDEVECSNNEAITDSKQTEEVIPQDEVESSNNEGNIINAIDDLKETEEVVPQNILEIFDERNEVTDERESNEAIVDFKNCILEIQDNAISTTENIKSPDDTIVPVEELIDSDPEVSSSYAQDGIAGASDDSKDSDVSQTDSENVENLIGIPKQEEKEEKPAELGGIVALVNIAPEVKREKKNSPFNLVPYVDTDSDCESIGEYEKRTAAGKLALQPLSQDVEQVQAVKQEQDVVNPNIVEIGVEQQGDSLPAVTVESSGQDERHEQSQSRASTPQNVLFTKTGQKIIVSKVAKGFNPNKKLSPREVRSVSSDAQILCSEANKSYEKLLTEGQEEPAALPVASPVSELDTATSQLKNEVDTPSSTKCSTLPDFGNYLDKEVSASREEINRAFNKIRRISGENNPSLGLVTDSVGQGTAGSSGLRFSLARKGNKIPMLVAGPPMGDCEAELVNFGSRPKQTADEYTFPPSPEQVKTEPDLTSYQALARPGKVGKKKPSRSALSHETEETQMQADMARQHEIKRTNRPRQTVLGNIRAGQSQCATGPAHTMPGPSLLRNVQPGPQSVSTSVIRQVPRQVSEHSHSPHQVYQTASFYRGLDTSQRAVPTPAQLLPVLTNTMLRHVIPQDPMQFVTIPCSPKQQPSTLITKSIKKYQAGFNLPNLDYEENIADFEQPPTDSLESAPADDEAGARSSVPTQSKEFLSVPKGGANVRRSVENLDHSYVMEVDSQLEDDFDLSRKLDEMEKDFDKPVAGQEESLEAIKSLLESQVQSHGSSDPNNSQGTISISDSEDMGLYSPGDSSAKPGLSESIIVLDDTILGDASLISINSEVSAKENIENSFLSPENTSFSSPIKDMKTVQRNEVTVNPNKVQKSQDETYDDVDDLLGDSDDDEDEVEEEEKKKPAAPLFKLVTPSEPSKKKPPQFVCPECHQKYGKNESQFNNHIRQKHNFPCKFCPLKFTYVNGLEEHSNSVHINETAEENSASFSCNICNKSFTRQGPYLKHKKRDHNIPCIECDMVFTNEPFLEEHMQSMHGINSPPPGKMAKMRKPTSPVEVKFQLANGMINDSPKKVLPKQDANIDNSKSEKKDPFKKTIVRLQAGKEISKKGKPSKTNFNKRMKDISVLSEDDTICEKCGQKFEELEAFEDHIELPHEHQCGMKNCELSFVYQYYLDLHIFEKHKTGIKPDERDRPIEESVKVAASTRNESVLEDQISLADLEVSEDYLPGIGPQSMMCGGDPAKVKSLKGYKIPKKSASPGNEDLDYSIDSSFNSSTSSHDNTPAKFSGSFSPERNAIKCYQCDMNFGDRASFDKHIANHYTLGKNILGSPSSSASTPFKCYECDFTFKDKALLDSHVSSHYSPRQQSVSQCTSQSTKILKCPLCNHYFEDMAKMMDHLKAKHHNGRSEKKHNFWCGLCRKSFESEKKFEDHEKLEHKYNCKHCHKAYILEVDLNHHVEKSHNMQSRHKEGFTCNLCGENISEMEMFKIHQSQRHSVPCYLDGCEKRFQHKKDLVAHLKSKHNIVQIRIGDDADDEHRGYLTTERSQANIDIAEWAESWIDSPMAIDHMVKVMKGVVKSRRHDLFLDKRERDQCSGSETSRLYQLSNPGFLGGGGEKDTVVIKHLIDRVFMVNFQQADHKLKELGAGSAFVYTSCVLFPETFIHQHQVQGKSREEAEQAFMEVAVDVEERKGLNQEIKEAAVRNRRDSEEDSGDEWVDHSDMEEDMED